jgi:hypothetical protein
VSRPGLGTEKLDLHRLAQVTQHFKLPFSLKWCAGRPSETGYDCSHTVFASRAFAL